MEPSAFIRHRECNGMRRRTRASDIAKNTKSGRQHSRPLVFAGGRCVLPRPMMATPAVHCSTSAFARCQESSAHASAWPYSHCHRSAPHLACLPRATQLLLCASAPAADEAPVPSSLSGVVQEGFHVVRKRRWLSQPRPNRAVKRTRSGAPPGPGGRYAVHFRPPGPGVTPLRSAYLQR